MSLDYFSLPLPRVSVVTLSKSASFNKDGVLRMAKDWYWSWNSNTLATSCEELTHWKRLWFWEGLGAGGEGDDRGWDGWMASQTRWTWVWVNSGSWWWTGRPGGLRFTGSQSRTRLSDWTELNWSSFLPLWVHCLRPGGRLEESRLSIHGAGVRGPSVVWVKGQPFSKEDQPHWSRREELWTNL